VKNGTVIFSSVPALGGWCLVLDDEYFTLNMLARCCWNVFRNFYFYQSKLHTFLSSVLDTVGLAMRKHLGI